jgi:tyrosine-specific transport protein
MHAIINMPFQFPFISKNSAFQLVTLAAIFLSFQGYGNSFYISSVARHGQMPTKSCQYTANLINRNNPRFHYEFVHYRYEQLSLQYSVPFLSMVKSQQANGDNENSSGESKTFLSTVQSFNQDDVIQTMKCSLLIAGTTIGGGFLAVPQSILVPLHGQFIPAAVSLTVVWGFLLIQSLYLSEAIVDTWQKRNDQDNMYNSSTSTSQNLPGISSCVQQNFSSLRGSSAITGALLFVLTVATMVSQLSRAGSIFVGMKCTPSTSCQVGSNFMSSSIVSSNLNDYRIGCIIAAVLGSICSFGLSGSTTATIHAVLTTIFLTSATILFYSGQQVADWSNCFVGGTLATTPWSGIGQAVPTMLQLLVYGEILPTVCSLLDYNKKKIRIAVAVGSFIPLVLLSGWSALAVALLPQLTKSVLSDPVDVLLQQSGLVSISLYILAFSAIATTILGCNLALETNYKDMINLLPPSIPTRMFRRRRGEVVDVVLKSSWLKYSIISIVPILISIISPKVFIQAIDFAGSYPVLILFGVIPSSIRIRGQKKQNSSSLSTTVVPIVLLLASLSWVGMELLSDLRTLFTKVFLTMLVS